MTSQETTYSFTATLSLFPTENGGRKRPVYDHYRPSFSFSTVMRFSGEISFPLVSELQPGGTTTAFIKLLPSRYIRQNLKSGDAFAVLEGDKVVGTGVIQQIEQENKTAVIQ